jgi:alkane 1-monooxygenase
MMSRGTLRNLRYLWSLVPGLVTIAGNAFGGIWSWSNLVFSLGFLALLEWFMPEDRHNESDAGSLLPDAVLLGHVLLQVLSLVMLFDSMANGRIAGIHLIGAGLSTGVHSGSSSIVIAHELVHRKHRAWQALGKFLLFTAGNVYFFIEHLRVHHKWVGTERDPATARYGEHLYVFFLRSLSGQLTGAIRLENQRLEHEGKGHFHPDHYVWRNLTGLLLVSFCSWYFFGLAGLGVWALQVLTANFLLEYTNYIEHYGLARSEHERVRETHSWQTDKVVSRFILIDLSRHSDHHFYASKPYHTLLSYDKSPVLPGGYASAVFMALIPPLWFRIVHPRLERFLGQTVAD